MPELPEVETIRRQLEKTLIGKKIESVDVLNKKIFAVDPKKIINSKIISIRRFGKALSIDFENNYSLLIHIKMTGQFVFGGDIDKHAVATFNLNNKKQLVYRDVRKFSWIKLVKTSEVNKEKFIKNLGPDALQISFEDFKKIFSKSKRNIKVFLMDQKNISGIGNIYANDALWLAKVSPRRNADSLSLSEVGNIYKAIRKVLKSGLKHGGASENDYIRPDGTKGDYQNNTLVYGKKDENCKVCKTKIEKIKLGGRGTYFCPNCQR